MKRGTVIGVDFDNTVVSYAGLFHEVAVERGLISRDTERSKQVIRDRVRQLPEGEGEWQRLQAVVYGPRMMEATLVEGVPEFFRLCRLNCVETRIISHKTPFASLDPTHTNLRTAALEWMTANRFFERTGFGLQRENILFAGSRTEKIELIRKRGCKHFIDDLLEVFLERSFPPDVEKILFSPCGRPNAPSGIVVLSDWDGINRYLFNGNERGPN